MSIWGKACKKDLEFLVKLQKWAVRLICHKKKHESSAPLFEKLNLLHISEIYIYTVQLFVYKFHHNCLPEIFDNFFIKNRDIHSYNTRQHNLFHVPKKASEWSAIIVKRIGVHCNNYFAKYIAMDCTYVTYKSRLKKHILKNNVLFLLN